MISLVIPLYNEESVLLPLHKALQECAPSWNDAYELILVNDGSNDRTSELLRQLAVNDDHIVVVELSRNFGHQAAISAGLQHASGDAVIIMDGDMQDPPQVLTEFLEKWRSGYEVVYAVRKNRKEGIRKKISYRIFYRLLKAVSEVNIHIDSGDFCLMDRKVVDVISKDMPENIRFVRGLRSYAGFRQVGVSYERPQRLAGEVKYTFRKLFRLASDGLFGFTTFPLRLAAYFGFLIAIPSFIIGMFLIVLRVFNLHLLGYSPSDAPGTATIAIGLYFLCGIILIILGVIGEYLGRVYIEVKRRPPFIVSSVYRKK